MDSAATGTAEASIDIVIEADSWRHQSSNIAVETRRAAELALNSQRADGAVCILLSEDAYVRELNAQFRGQDKPTNVLSFPAPQGGPEPVLGDIVLAYETVEREALEQGKPFLHHAQHLIVHGVLHLLGFDHEEDADARTMEDLETRLLISLNIPDPYLSR